MKRALGIFPAYAPPNNLAATVNDQANWSVTLPRRGFVPTWLIGQVATRPQIISWIQQFVASVQPGDSAALVFCGHGATSGGHQCIVGSDLQPVWDHELQAMLSLTSPSAKLDVVLDCCYAGTGSYDREAEDRDPNAPPKIDQTIVPQVFKGKLKIPKNAVPPVDVAERTVPAWREWAAGSPTQITYGVMSGGKMNSLFSLFECWALRVYPTMIAVDIMNNVRQYVVAVIPSQVPQLTGMNLDQVPF